MAIAANQNEKILFCNWKIDNWPQKVLDLNISN